MKLATATVFALAIALTACERHSFDFEKANAAALRPAQPAMDSRTVSDLAIAIAEIERGDPEEAADAYAALVTSFEGKRYRWRLYLVAPLCGETQCNALPFDDGGKAVGVVGGWMPRIAFSDVDRGRLLSECGERPKCPFTVEATLAELTLSTEHFTALALADAVLLAANE